MQLNLALPEPSDDVTSAAPKGRPPTSWDQLDEAARVAALEKLTRLIARMLADAADKEARHE